MNLKYIKSGSHTTWAGEEMPTFFHVLSLFAHCKL